MDCAVAIASATAHSCRHAYAYGLCGSMVDLGACRQGGRSACKTENQDTSSDSYTRICWTASCMMVLLQHVHPRLNCHQLCLLAGPLHPDADRPSTCAEMSVVQTGVPLCLPRQAGHARMRRFQRKFLTSALPTMPR